jgi:hypothetical protein
MHYHVETNALICLIKRLDETYSGDSVYFSCYQKPCHLATGIFVSEHQHFSNNTYFTSIHSETAVRANHQLINQNAIYVAVDYNFNSEVFQRTQDFPFGQRVPHSTFPTHHRLWDTTLVQAWIGPWVCRSLRFLGFLDTRHMNVARLSDQCSCRFCPQEIFLVLISVRGGVDPRAV